MSYADELFDLKDKIIIVTGAAGQIGREICEAYLKMSAKVVAFDKVAAKSQLAGVDYRAVDITKKDEVTAAFEYVFRKYNRVDVLVNNAGVSVFEPFEERKEEGIDYVMDVNLKGTFFCIQAYVNLFDKYKAANGAIVNIASFYGVISPDFRIYTDCARKNSEIYGATKAGVIQMTKYFAVHLAERNIRVNAVSPGGIYNPANPQGEDFIKNFSARCPMKRMGKDAELIGVLVYLSSDSASYTTGANIIVDGGMSCW